MEPQVNPRDLVGKFVILEQTNPDQAHSSYYDGEWLVVDATPLSVYAIKREAGYTGTEIRAFALQGNHAYRVAKVEDNRTALVRLADRMAQFARTPEDNSRKLEWWLEVYERAQRVAEKLNGIIGAQDEADLDSSSFPEDDPDQCEDCECEETCEARPAPVAGIVEIERKPDGTIGSIYARGPVIVKLV